MTVLNDVFTQTTEILGNQGRVIEAVEEGNSAIEKSQLQLDSFLGNSAQILNVDSVLGSDDNDGLTRETSFKTYQKLISSVTTSGRVIARSYSPLDINYLRIFNLAPQLITFEGRDPNTGAFSTQPFTFLDAVNSTIHPGGYMAFGSLLVEFRNIECVMAHSRNSNPVRSFKGVACVDMVSSPLTKTGASSAAFVRGKKVIMTRSASVFDPSSDGHVIHGVGAGVDPRTVNLVEADFGSA